MDSRRSSYAQILARASIQASSFSCRYRDDEVRSDARERYDGRCSAYVYLTMDRRLPLNPAPAPSILQKRAYHARLSLLGFPVDCLSLLHWGLAVRSGFYPARYLRLRLRKYDFARQLDRVPTLVDHSWSVSPRPALFKQNTAPTTARGAPGCLRSCQLYPTAIQQEAELDQDWLYAAPVIRARRIGLQSQFQGSCRTDLKGFCFLFRHIDLLHGFALERAH
jgi:hypothetical protein